MKFLVYGAGPLGSYYAAKLKQADQDVTIVSRGKRFSHIRRRGIELEPFEGGEKTRIKIPAIDRLGPLDAFDLVMVLVGKNYYPGVLPFLVANIATPNVMFVGNNVAGPSEMIRLLGKERVLLGFPGMSATLENRVVRYQRQFKPKITIGEIEGAVSERINQFVEVFNDAGIEAELCDNMDGWLKYHAAVFLPLIFAYIKAGRDVRALSKEKETLSLLIKAIREGFNVLNELGYSTISDRLRRLDRLPMIILTPIVRRQLGKKEAEYAFHHVPAMQKELEVLDEEFVELINSSSIPTPNYDELKASINEQSS